MLDEPVGLFAYPNGKPGIDYAAVAAGIVRAQGFSAAFSTRWGAVKPESDLFQMPRFTPWDHGRGAFGVRLLRNLVGRA